MENWSHDAATEWQPYSPASSPVLYRTEEVTWAATLRYIIKTRGFGNSVVDNREKDDESVISGDSDRNGGRALNDERRSLI